MVSSLNILSQNVLGSQTKVGMSQMEKAWIGKGLGFNLCVAPCPMLSLYFRSRRLRVSEGILRQRWKTLEGLRDGFGIGEKVIVDIQTGVTYKKVLNTE